MLYLLHITVKVPGVLYRHSIMLNIVLAFASCHLVPQPLYHATFNTSTHISALTNTYIYIVCVHLGTLSHLEIIDNVY